jgi:hypothetical protein
VDSSPPFKSATTGGAAAATRRHPPSGAGPSTCGPAAAAEPRPCDAAIRAGARHQAPNAAAVGLAQILLQIRAAQGLAPPVQGRQHFLSSDLLPSAPLGQ